ncbi:MAG: SUF system NifU family Fe-S cluster assembly protein [Acidimicrobiia bacterium]
MSLEDLYREVILDHYRNPRNQGHLSSPDARGHGVNPLCGDEVTIELSFDGDRVVDVAVEGQGCSISQSSVSMMSEAIKGKTRDEIEELNRRFRDMMSLDGDNDPGIDPDRPGSVLGDMEALQGVRKYPVRIKCATLGWNVLKDALNS